MKNNRFIKDTQWSEEEVDKITRLYLDTFLPKALATEMYDHLKEVSIEERIERLKNKILIKNAMYLYKGSDVGINKENLYKYTEIENKEVLEELTPRSPFSLIPVENIKIEDWELECLPKLKNKEYGK